MPDPNSAPNALLVEGPDDKHVVYHLRQRSHPMPDFSTKPKGNVDSLLDSIEAEVKVSGRIVLGVVMDANDDPEARWQAVVERFGRVNVQLPDRPQASGTIVDGSDENPRIGVWLMPDNGSSGELEDFIEKMIPPTDPVWPLSQDYVDGIREEHRKFRPGKVLRAKVYAWLATREIPGRMGAAIGAGDLRVDVMETQAFVQWLRNLFA